MKIVEKKLLSLKDAPDSVFHFNGVTIRKRRRTAFPAMEQSQISGQYQWFISTDRELAMNLRPEQLVQRLEILDKHLFDINVDFEFVEEAAQDAYVYLAHIIQQHFGGTFLNDQKSLVVVLIADIIVVDVDWMVTRRIKEKDERNTLVFQFATLVKMFELLNKPSNN